MSNKKKTPANTVLEKLGHEGEVLDAQRKIIDVLAAVEKERPGSAERVMRMAAAYYGFALPAAPHLNESGS